MSQSPGMNVTNRATRGLAALRNPQDAEILRLAVPAFGSLVAEPLFLLADSAIVGRIGTVPLGGLGVASQALTTLVSVSIFLAYGTTAAVARRLGSGDRKAAIRLGIDGLWLAVAIGAVVLAAGWPLAPLVVRAFGATAAVTGQAVTYLRISLIGAPSMLLVLAGTGVLRGLQDTWTPLVVAVTANVANVVLNATFVLGLRWGIAGSATGSVVAQTGMAAAYLTVVARGARRAGVLLAPDLPGVRSAALAGGALVVRTLALQAVSPRTRSPSGCGTCSPWPWTPSRSPGRRSPAGTWAPGTRPGPARPPTGWSPGAWSTGSYSARCCWPPGRCCPRCSASPPGCGTCCWPCC